MYFIKRNNRYINVAGKSFRSFMQGDLDILPNQVATEEDWINHLSTLFPQVRLKQYLELRSMDACSWGQICGQLCRLFLLNLHFFHLKQYNCCSKTVIPLGNDTN